MELKVGIDEDLHKKLKRVQDLLSQKLRKHVSLEEAMEVLVREYMQRHDPVEKAKRAKEREAKLAESGKCIKNLHGTSHVNRSKGSRRSKRKALPAKVRHAINLRDEGRCVYRGRGNQRCGQGRWVEVHHRVPVSAGGEDRIDNLVTLCSQHHSMLHQQVLML